jgi:hypothetical protein
VCFVVIVCLSLVVYSHVASLLGQAGKVGLGVGLWGFSKGFAIALQNVRVTVRVFDAAIIAPLPNRLHSAAFVPLDIELELFNQGSPGTPHVLIPVAVLEWSNRFKFAVNVCAGRVVRVAVDLIEPPAPFDSDIFHGFAFLLVVLHRQTINTTAHANAIKIVTMIPNISASIPSRLARAVSSGMDCGRWIDALNVKPE